MEKYVVVIAHVGVNVFTTLGPYETTSVAEADARLARAADDTYWAVVSTLYDPENFDTKYDSRFRRRIKDILENGDVDWQNWKFAENEGD